MMTKNRPGGWWSACQEPCLVSEWDANTGFHEKRDKNQPSIGSGEEWSGWRWCQEQRIGEGHCLVSAGSLSLRKRKPSAPHLPVMVDPLGLPDHLLDSATSIFFSLARGVAECSSGILWKHLVGRLGCLIIGELPLSGRRWSCFLWVSADASSLCANKEICLLRSHYKCPLFYMVVWTESSHIYGKISYWGRVGSLCILPAPTSLGRS